MAEEGSRGTKKPLRRMVSLASFRSGAPDVPVNENDRKTRVRDEVSRRPVKGHSKKFKAVLHAGARRGSGEMTVAMEKQRRSSLGVSSKEHSHPGSSKQASGGFLTPALSRFSFRSVSVPKADLLLIPDAGPYPTQGIECTPFGTQWSKDLFSLYHNAIRRELQDLRRLMDSVRSRLEHGTLTMAHIAVLYTWLDDFREEVSAIFLIHETIIFPWVEAAVSLDGNLEKSERIQLQSRISSLFGDIESVPDLEPATFTAAAYGTLNSASLNLCSSLSDYFSEIESRMPEMLEMFFTPDSKKELELVAISRLASGRKPQLILPSLVRWMDSRKAAEWTAKTLRSRPRLMMGYWTRQYQKTHTTLVDRICRTDTL